MSAFVFLEMNGLEVCAPPDEPGHLVNSLFRTSQTGENEFTVQALDTYLRSRCRWIGAN